MQVVNEYNWPERSLTYLCRAVLDLKHTDLATKEDKLYHIDKWAALFKATTWEEIKMYAQKDEYMEEASKTIYQLSQDKNIRLQCEAREDYYRRQRSVQHYIEEQACAAH